MFAVNFYYENLSVLSDSLEEFLGYVNHQGTVVLFIVLKIYKSYIYAVKIRRHSIL